MFSSTDTPLGPAVQGMLDRWIAGTRRVDTEKAREEFLHAMLTNPSLVPLGPAGNYAGRAVTWLPGHIIGEGALPPRKYGPQRADLMIIVDVPMAQDLKKETGFHWSGSCREVIRDLFKQKGINIDTAYITAATKFRNPYQKKSIPKLWQDECKWHLAREIELVNPKYIVVFGADPLKMMLGSSAKVESYTGAMTSFEFDTPKGGIQTVFGGDRPQLIAFATINSYLAKPERWPALLGALSHLTDAMGISKLDGLGNYIAVHTAEHLGRILQENRGAQMIAMDCEWHGDSPLRDDGELLTIQISFRPFESFVIFLHSMASGTRFYPHAAAAIHLLRQFFIEHPDIMIIGQNLRADLRWLIDSGLNIVHQFAFNGFDTMLGSHIISEEDAHDLTTLTLRYTNMGRYDYEVQRLLDKGYSHSRLPDEVMLKYAGADTDALFRMVAPIQTIMWQDHLDYCRQHGIEDAYSAVESLESAAANNRQYHPTMWNLFKHIVMPVSLPINELEMEGMLTDNDRILELTKAYQEVHDILLADIRRMVGDPNFNPNSTLQKKELFFADPEKPDDDGIHRVRLGLTPLTVTGTRPKTWERAMQDGEVHYEPGVGWKSDSHQPCADDETLAAYEINYEGQLAGDIAKAMRSYSLIHGILARLLTMPNEDGKYEKGFPQYIDRDGKIRTSILQMTKTGRQNSRNPNAHNLPKSKEAQFYRVCMETIGRPLPTIRSCFIPEEGGVFIEADIQSAELWAIAYWAQDPVFIEALNTKDAFGDPVSFHTVSMLKFFKLPYTFEEVDAIMSAGGPEGAKLKMYRTGTKAVNFGMPYGRGARTIYQEVKSNGVDCTIADAESWIEGYASTFSVVWDKLEWCRTQVWNPGYLVNPYGRKRHFNIVDDSDYMAAQEREACNFNIQSSVADFLSAALVRLVMERNRREMRTRVKLTIHDAIMLWVPYEEIEMACDLLHWAMVDAPGAVVPGWNLRFGIDYEVNDRWNEKPNPYWLRDVSNGFIDKRPKCALCKKKIPSESDERKLVLPNGKPGKVCSACA